MCCVVLFHFSFFFFSFPDQKATEEKASKEKKNQAFDEITKFMDSDRVKSASDADLFVSFMFDCLIVLIFCRLK
jgi:hypothetical protein